MSNSEQPLRIATVGDIHLGHPRVPTSEIVANLRVAFPDNAETAQLDLIIIEGDVFDNLLELPDDDVVDIDMWIFYMLRICAKHDIVLLVLEGTPLHDRFQSQRFVTLNEITELNCNLIYVKTVSVEYIAKLGIHVLCVPDEAHPTPERTLKEVRELLRAKGLTQVDYAVMHGMFEYQVPAGAHGVHFHEADAYLELVRHLIFIGHVHTFTRYKRIIASGSFDRLAHNEEEPKGHTRAEVWNGNYNVTFVENEGAKKFVTVDCRGLSLEETLAKVNEEAGMLPVGSFVRVRAEESNPILSHMELLIRNYPLFTWAKKAEGEEKEVEFEDEQEFVYTPITLTRENIPTMLMERIANVPNISAQVLAAAEELIREAL